MGKIIGIDLGTTFSAVAVMEGGKATIIPNKEGNRTTPSIVGMKGKDILVGEPAKKQMVLNPENTVASIKREMGSNYKVKIEGKEYTAEQISAMILQKMKKDAEEYLGQKIEDAVITVPAYFTDSQRQATKDAGKIAGLNVKRIINEPTAASLAYGLDKSQAHTIFVFDFGGGTFDVSILELDNGVFEVKATCGNNKLGGNDIDDKIITWLKQEFKKESGIDLSNDAQAMQRLKDASENAKKELSSAMQTSINLPYITADQNGPKHLTKELTRAKLEELCEDIFEKLIEPTKTALQDAKNPKIDEVVLVGGSTRIPKVQAIVRELTGREANKSINPDEAVALGAAIQAGVLGGEVKDVLLLDVTPLSLGIETLGGVSTKIIQKNTTIPTKESQIFSTAADNQPAVDIHVLQGERPMAADNKTLGRFQLTGIPPAPRGVPQIEVSFDIDANGIVHVIAKDKGTGKEQDIVIKESNRLSEEDVKKMQKEAEEHAEEDKKKEELIKAKNIGGTIIYSTEKSLKELGEKVDKAVKEEIEKAVQELKEVIAKDDVEEIKKKTEALQQAAYKIAEQLYKQQAEKQQEGQQGAQGEAGGKEGEKKEKEKVVDAEYEMKDKEKEEEKKEKGKEGKKEEK